MRGHFLRALELRLWKRLAQTAGLGMDGNLWEGNLDGIQWDTALGLVFDAVYPLSFLCWSLAFGIDRSWVSEEFEEL